jgi:hypothetical protein
MPASPDSAARPGRGWWWLVLALLLSVGAFVPAAAPIAAPAAVVTRPAPPPTTAPGPTRVPGLWMPVAGAVVRGFDVRAGPYGAGHRGSTSRRPWGSWCGRRPRGGSCSPGRWPGTTWVSVRVAPGVLVTLGPVLDPTVRAGPVRARSPIGRVGPGHGATLHLSVRVDGVYVDPLPYLLDRPRARLAPLLSPGGLPPPERAHQG